MKALTIWPFRHRPHNSNYSSLPKQGWRTVSGWPYLESIFLEGPDKSTYVRSLLSNGEKEQIQQVLLRNIDVFAWTHSDMAGINPVHASHKLNVISQAS